MSTITIGIPTYNRARYIARTLESACAQTYKHVEVLVSDDGSTDGSPEIIRSFGDKVRYHRNPKNIGMWPNFAILTELATTEYFSWLQDDDMIHADFARRAVEAFEANPEIVMYTAFSLTGWSSDTFYHPQLYGPPISLDWMGSKLRILDGFLVLPLSFFATFSMPPVTAYRTETIRRACVGLDPDDVLFNERIIQSRAVAGHLVAVDPRPGGIFFRHDSQGHLVAGHGNLTEYSRQWGKMASTLCRMLESRPDQGWEKTLTDWINTMSPYDSRSMLSDLPPESYWPKDEPLVREICRLVLNHIPEEFHGRHRRLPAAKPSVENPIKNLARQLTPPLFWEALKKLRTISTPVK